MSNRLNQYSLDKAYRDVVNLTLWPMGMRMQRWKSLLQSSFPGKIGGCYPGKLGGCHADRILLALATDGFLLSYEVEETGSVFSTINMIMI